MRSRGNRTYQEIVHRLRWVVSALVLFSMMGSMLVMPPSVALAASFTVTSTDDAVDNDLTDGECKTDLSGNPCTLRAAIQQANDLAGIESTITLPAGTFNLTISGADGSDPAATGDLDIKQELTIQGAGPGSTIIDANQIDRIFETNITGHTDRPVTIKDMTLRNGRVSAYGGAIHMHEVVTIDNVVLEDNRSDSLGGAIYGEPGANLTISNSTLQNNVGGGLGGGGIYMNEGTTFNMNNCTVRANESRSGGGGIHLRGSQGSIDSSTIGGPNDEDGNTAYDSGGGILMYAYSDMVIKNSLIQKNIAYNRSGGGIVNYGRAELDSVLVWENRAEIMNGGGIFNASVDGLEERAVMTLKNSDIYANVAWTEFNEYPPVYGSPNNTHPISGYDKVNYGDSYGAGGGLVNINDATLVFYDSTVRNNKAIVEGGGMVNRGSRALLYNTTFEGNTLRGVWEKTANYDNPKWIGRGGAILSDAKNNDAKIELYNSVIKNNETGGAGGGINNTSGDLHIENSLIEGNKAGENIYNELRGGGGILNYHNYRFNIINTIVRNNTASGHGGGLYNSSAKVNIIDSAFIGNESGQQGGGIMSDLRYYDYKDGRGPVPMWGSHIFIDNTTFSGNHARRGGAIYNGHVYSDPIRKPNEHSWFQITNSTIVNNTSVTMGNAIINNHNDTSSPEYETWIRNSIIANNSPNTDCTTQGGNVPMTSYGYNIFTSNSCGNWLNTATDHKTNPQLANLEYNEGPSLGDTRRETWSHALLAGSPAINAIPTSDGSNGCPADDQRRFARERTNANRCDIGAYEVYPPVANDDIAGTTSGNQVVINVLANDTDPDGSGVNSSISGSGINSTTVTIVSNPASGSVSVNPTTGEITYTPGDSGVQSFTYTVKDNHGHVSNTATVEVYVDDPTPEPTIDPTPEPTPEPLDCQNPASTLEDNWRTDKVGPGGIGRAVQTDGGSTTAMCGTGIGLWGDNDGFQYTYQEVDSNFKQITAKVAYWDALGDSTYSKVGVMIRSSLNKTASHASIIMNSNNWVRTYSRQNDQERPNYDIYNSEHAGIRYTRRSDAGVGTKKPAIPGWLRLTRDGNTIYAYHSTNGVDWEQVGLPITLNDLSGTFLVGMMISPDNNTADNSLRSQARFENVSIENKAPAVPANPIDTPAFQDCNTANNTLAGAWQYADTRGGSTRIMAGDESELFTCSSGARLRHNSSSDSFQYVYQQIASSTPFVQLTARVTDWDPGYDATNARAGLMIRTSTDSDAAYVGALLTGDKGLYGQSRANNGNSTSYNTDFGGRPPVPIWLRVTKDGATVSSEYSIDSEVWQQIGTPQNLSFGSNLLIGFASAADHTSSSSALARATYSDIKLTTTPEPEATLLPATVDFGEQASGNETLTLRNTGPVDLENINITLTGDSVFAMSHSCPSTLTPGQSCSIDITFTPTGQESYAGTVTVATNAAEDDVATLVGAGLLDPELTLFPATAMSFGDILVGETSAPPRVLTLRNSGGDTLNITSIDAGGSEMSIVPGGTCSDAPFTLNVGESCTYQLAFSPTSGGNKTQTLRIESNDPNNNPHEITLTGKGIAPGVEFTWAGNPFSVTEGSTSSIYNVRLTSQPSALVTIHLTPINDQIQLTSPSSIEFTPSNWQTYQRVYVQAVDDNFIEGPHASAVQHTASGGGYDGATLDDVQVAITDNDSGNITLSPATMTFGPQEVGYESGTQTIEMKNDGDTITIDAIELSTNTDFTINTSACGSIPFVFNAGATCDITITFKPTAEGTRSDTLIVTDDGGKKYGASLSGTGQGQQTINFATVNDMTYGESTTLNATATSGLPVSFSIVGDGPATINGNILTATGVGNVTIRASQPGDATRGPAPDVDQTITVGKANLTITADNKNRPPQTENPELTVTYSGFVNGDTESVLTGSFEITTTATLGSPEGTYPITVEQDSLSATNYDFTFVNGTLSVGKLSQSITFNTLADRPYSDEPFTLNATASSDLPISYEILNGPATINGDQLTMTGLGSVTVRAKQEGNDQWAAAASVDQSFTITKADQSITFDPPDRTYGDAPFTLNATASSGLPVSYEVLSGPITLAGSTATITGTGTVEIRASQAGNTSFNAAATITETFTINKAPLTITAEDKTRYEKTSNPPFTITYSGFVNGDNQYNPTVISGDPDVSTTADINSSAGDYPIVVTQGTLNAENYTFVFVNGTITIKQLPPSGGGGGGGGNNPGGGNDNTGNDNTGNDNTGNDNTGNDNTGNDNTGNNNKRPKTRTPSNNNGGNTGKDTTVWQKLPQTITFPPLPNRVYGEYPFMLNATASSGLPVRYEIVSGPATLSNNIVTLTGEGSVKIRAIQDGNAYYEPAKPVEQTFTVTIEIDEGEGEELPPPGGNGNEPEPEPDSDQEVTGIPSPLILFNANTVKDTVPGGRFTVRVEILNEGDGALKDVEVTVTLPPYLSFSNKPDANWSDNADRTFSYRINELAAGESQPLPVLSAEVANDVPDGTELVLQATINGTSNGTTYDHGNTATVLVVGKVQPENNRNHVYLPSVFAP